MKPTDLISMLPSVDNICKEADLQISEWLADSTNNEKDHYRVAFRRSLEYIIRSITKDSPTYLNNDDRLKFAEWCIMYGVVYYYNEDDVDYYIDDSKEIFRSIEQVYEKFKNS
jgi:hypothetical protein